MPVKIPQSLRTMLEDRAVPRALPPRFTTHSRQCQHHSARHDPQSDDASSGKQAASRRRRNETGYRRGVRSEQVHFSHPAQYDFAHDAHGRRRIASQGERDPFHQ